MVPPLSTHAGQDASKRPPKSRTPTALFSRCCLSCAGWAVTARPSRLGQGCFGGRGLVTLGAGALPMPQLQLQTDFRTDTVPTTDDGAQAPDYKRPCVMFSAPITVDRTRTRQ